ncbi:MAG: ATP-binding protein [Candidatus Woesearchaeota archaeon]
MKIAFIGTHGVGKTSTCHFLAYLIKAKLLDGSDARVEVVSEVARILSREKKIPINEQTTLEAQQMIAQTQIDAEKEAAKHNDIVICDRAYLDNIAYAEHKFGKQNLFHQIGPSWMQTYDYLFKVPITKMPYEDGIRSTDPEFQKAIDKRIDELIKLWGVKCEVLPIEGRDGTFAYEMALARFFSDRIDLSQFGAVKKQGVTLEAFGK